MGYGTASTATASGVNDVDALISGYKWSTTALTYALPTLASQYASGVYNPANDENGSFQPVAGGLATAVASVMAQMSAVSGLSITLTGNTSAATMLIGRTGQTATAHAYLPETGPSKGGDVWFGLDTAFDAPVKGSYGWATALHEIGHALGLKHAHSYIGGVGLYADDLGVIAQPVSATRDSVEFAVMSYRSYVNQDLAIFDYYTNEDYGFPQSLMMLDIAALQQMYGADFSTNGGNTTYTFSATTGEMFVNGVGQGAPGANRIFLTIWDGGGVDTYDFSNYSSNLTVDLAPGSWSLLSSAQRANLGNGNYASGNVYNALQYQGDAASLIENATGGSGNDTIAGNAADNLLAGNAGADSLSGGAGNDTFAGGAGNDTIDGGADSDTVSFAGAAAGLSVAMGVGVWTAQDGQGGVDTISNVENVAGGDFNDTLIGNASNNVLMGGAGADVLNGGAGVDTMVGGDGSDIYYVDNAGDVVSETNANQATGGYDIVFSTINITLSANIEQLVIQGAATAGTGGSNANYLYAGNSGLSLTLDGGGGDDVIYVSLAGHNTIAGGAGVDTLLIYGGSNQANGGLGSDIYYTYSASDVLSEASGDGIDTVYATYNIVLNAGFEQLLLSGSATAATGSADNNIIYGNSTSGAVSIQGLGGADVIFGGSFNDTLEGGDGVDLLFGLGGANTLAGGNDTDVYYIESAGNTVVETATGGFDTMYSNFAGATTLAANVEQLILYGAATGGTGSSGNDYLYANSAAGSVTLDGAGGADYLLCSAQNDTLIGGAGNDQIDLSTGGNDAVRYNASGAMGADVVFGFDADPAGGQDVIDLTGRGYTDLTNISVAVSGGNTLVTFNAGSLSGATITLVGVAAANVTAQDFVF
jgi:serralysin